MAASITSVWLLLISAVPIWQIEARKRSDDRPSSLRAAEEARSSRSINTAKIEWMTENFTNTRGYGTQRFYASECAGDRFTQTDYGDEFGVVFRGPDGTPVSDLDYVGPRQYLFDGSQLWYHVMDSIAARVLPEDERSVNGVDDVRNLGLVPFARNARLEDVLRPDKLDELRFEETREGNLTVVSAIGGPTIVRWWIDPEREWSVTKTQFVVDGQPELEADVQLARYESTWFPNRVDYYRVLPDGSRALERRVQVLSCEINQPHHRRTLEPDAIGIEPGMQITYFGADVPERLRYWDGSQAVSFEEFAAEVASGNVGYGKTIAREISKLSGLSVPTMPESAGDSPGDHAPSGRMQRADDPWELYTADFIVRHRLTPEQTETALRVLRQCQEMRARIWGAQRSVSTSRAPPEPDAGAAATTSAPASARSPEGDEPAARINEIFEGRLKPRLDSVLTRAQRAAAASRPAATTGDGKK